MHRITAAASVLFGVCFFGTVASVNVPHHGTDAEVLEWWAKPSSLTAGTTSMTFAILTAVLFAVVTGSVLLLAGDRSAPLVAFGRTMATAFTVTLLVSAALRGVIGHLVNVDERPRPGLDVLDYTTSLNYTMLGVVVMTCFAVTVVTIGAVVLRTGMLARWHGVASIALGLVVLGAVAAMYGAYTVPLAILWGLCTAVAVLRAPSVPSAVEARETVGTMSA